jgi:uncharacterized protein YifE (UPF0438 family)
MCKDTHIVPNHTMLFKGMFSHRCHKCSCVFIPYDYIPCPRCGFVENISNEFIKTMAVMILMNNCHKPATHRPRRITVVEDFITISLAVIFKEHGESKNNYFSKSINNYIGKLNFKYLAYLPDHLRNIAERVYKAIASESMDDAEGKRLHQNDASKPLMILSADLEGDSISTESMNISLELIRHFSYLISGFSVSAYSYKNSSASTLGDITTEEAKILGRFGIWMRGLANGNFQPLTQAQIRFIAVSRFKETPVAIYEKAWRKFQLIKPQDIYAPFCSSRSAVPDEYDLDSLPGARDDNYTDIDDPY